MSAALIEHRVEALLKVLPIEGSAIDTARRFVLAVAKISPDLLPEALRHPLATEILRGRAAYPELLARLETAHEVEQVFVLDAIGRIAQAQGASEAELVVLRRYARLNRPEVAGAAQIALAMAKDPETVVRLRQVLRAPDINQQITAARLLGHARDPSALPDLLVALTPTRATLAQAIIWALGEIGEPAVVTTLHAVLSDHFLTTQVLDSLSRLGRAESFVVILPFITSAARDERVAALSALARITQRDAEGIPVEAADQARPMLLRIVERDESRLARYHAYLAYVGLGGELASNRVMLALGAGLSSNALDPMSAFFSTRGAAPKS